MIKGKQWAPALVAAAGTEATVLLRQVVVARLAGLETLGALLLLMLVLRFMHMATDLAGDRYLVTRPDHQVKGALNLLHAYSILRGTLCAAALVAALPLLPSLPSDFATFSLVAACLLKGIVHQGYRLGQRQMNFNAMLWVELLPAWIALAALVPLIMVLTPIEAIAAAFMIQQVLETIQSWRLSGGAKFRPDFRSTQRNAFLQYGLPLLLTSFTLFFSMQGERLVLGVSLPVETFTPLAAAVQLALIPALLINRVMLTILLPWMRSLTREDLAAVTKKLTLPLLAFGMTAASLFSVGANWGMALLYGDGIYVAPGILGLIALIQMGRILRSPDSITAQALGLTKIPMYGNMIRATSVPVMGLMLAISDTLWSAFLPLLVGEVLAFAFQKFALADHLKPSPESTLSPAPLSQKEALT